MYGEGIREQRFNPKDATKHRIGTYAHKQHAGKTFETDTDLNLAFNVARNCARLSTLEAAVAPSQGRTRLEFRKASKLPGIHPSLGDLCSAPAYYLSEGYASPMHKDHSAACFPEAIVWMAQNKLPSDGWRFAIPSASIMFCLDRAWPCFCLLQAHDVLHGTLHTEDGHDALGHAGVSRDVLSNEQARDAPRRD
jgi:hypothetical protein